MGLRSLVALVGVALVAGNATATTVTLQNGLNGYAGCIDKELRRPGADFNFDANNQPYADWSLMAGEG